MSRRHQYAIENLEAEQREAVDSALWSAVRVLEEHAELKMRMARRAAEGGLSTVSEGFAGGARDAHEQAQRIRSVLFGPGSGDGVPPLATRPAAARAAAGRRKAARRNIKTARRRRS